MNWENNWLCCHVRDLPSGATGWVTTDALCGVGEDGTLTVNEDAIAWPEPSDTAMWPVSRRRWERDSVTQTTDEIHKRTASAMMEQLGWTRGESND